jgi:hypothetical protein
MKNLLISIVFLSIFACCKNSKPATQSSSVTTTTSSAVVQEQETELPDSLYRVIVSFISIGEGTDLKAKDQLQEIMNNHQRDFGMPLASEEYRWGREGEVDICFKMKNENRKAKDTFVRQLKDTFSQNKLIQIEENAVCRHKRE